MVPAGWFRRGRAPKEQARQWVRKISVDTIVKSRFHTLTLGFAYSGLLSEAMEEGSEDAGFDFRPRVAFGQDDFNKLLVQVM